MINETGRYVIDAALHLLDRQVVDKDGMASGKVDDLELTVPSGGGAPYITAILSGPGALGRMLGGRAGRALESIQRRLSDQTEPPRIPFGVVKLVDSHIDLTVSREELDVTKLEDWVRDRIISKIPGAQHEA